MALLPAPKIELSEGTSGVPKTRGARPWVNTALGVGHMVLLKKIFNYIAVEETPPPLHGELFPISSKGSFMCTHRIARTYHNLCYTRREALARTGNSSIQRCQPGTTHICTIMTKHPYNLQKNPYKLSAPLQNPILV